MNTFRWFLIDAANVAVGGDALSKPDYTQADGWYGATVPGTVLTTLVENGVYPEPLYGENMRAIPESLNKASYWYRGVFEAPQSAGGKDRLWLRLHGINYKAEVWLGGEQIGRMDGAFSRGIFDITNHVQLGAPAALAVKILPLEHPGVPHEHTWADGNGKNGGETAGDGATFCCTIGWDWLPAVRDRAMGIWQDVELASTGPVVIEDPYVITSNLPLPKPEFAELTLRVTLRNVSNQPQSAKLTGQIDGEPGSITAPEIQLAPGESRELTLTSSDTPALRVESPRLWWPNGYGAPHLYSLKLNVATDGGGAGVSDEQSVTFGIRTITYEMPGSEALTIVVNGVPVIAKGGNWGMDDGMKRIPAERLDAQVQLHRLANATMLRNWVGQSTSKALYEACDRHGILMWDEFFQPNPSDGPDPYDEPMYLANVREKILRFRHHACVALWCARNEGDPPPGIDKGIAELIDQLDPYRLYQASSTRGRGVLSHGPYCWREPRKFYEMPHGAGEAFKTETGTVSIPTLEAVRGMMPERDWSGINDAWAQHDLCRGAQRGNEFPHIMAARYGKVVSFEDFVRKAQLMNWESYRAMYEGRFAKLFAPVTGILTWMSHPAQPSLAWQYYSYDLDTHASLFAVRSACEPVHIMLNEQEGNVMVVNSLPAPLDGYKARVRHYNLDGTLAGEQNFVVEDGAPLSAIDLGPADKPGIMTETHFVKLSLLGEDDLPVSENLYWRAGEANSDNLQALDTLPVAALDCEASLTQDEQGKSVVVVKVGNPSASPALMAHLQLRNAETHERILPVYADDNYVSLLPGESRTLRLQTSALGGAKPLLALDGWNVTVGNGSLGSVPVVDNPHALEVHEWGELPPVESTAQINPTF